MLEIVQIPALEVQDNYIYLLHSAGETAVIDPAIADPVIEACEARGWTLTYIWNTHHHWDHTSGNKALKRKYGCTVIGNKHDASRIPAIDTMIEEGDSVTLGDTTATVIDVSGHTLGHIAYHFAKEEALFIGDTLFSLGCGRMFEGTPEMFHTALEKIKQLPPKTKIYCGHEYTLSNGKFAVTVDPNNAALHQHIKKAQKQRENGQPTVPTTLAEELAANPFLRTTDPTIKANLHMPEASPIEIFAELRHRKNNF